MVLTGKQLAWAKVYICCSLIEKQVIFLHHCNTRNPCLTIASQLLHLLNVRSHQSSLYPLPHTTTKPLLQFHPNKSHDENCGAFGIYNKVKIVSIRLLINKRTNEMEVELSHFMTKSTKMDDIDD